MPVAVPQPEPHSVGGVLVHMPHVCSVSYTQSKCPDKDKSKQQVKHCMKYENFVMLR